MQGTCLTICFLSVFFANELTESMQDQAESKDQLKIVKFVWNMNKKMAVGIHRFEGLIHNEFQELCEMGCARPRPSGSPRMPTGAVSALVTVGPHSWW